MMSLYIYLSLGTDDVLLLEVMISDVVLENNEMEYRNIKICTMLHDAEVLRPQGHWVYCW